MLLSSFLSLVSSRPLVIMGAFGTMLMKEKDLPKDLCPELYNVQYPEVVKKVLRQYAEAGADILECNTFGGTRVKLDEYGLGSRVNELNTQAIKLALQVKNEIKKAQAVRAGPCTRPQDTRSDTPLPPASYPLPLIAASLGPTGKLIEPLSDFSYEEAFKNFQEQTEILVRAGADLLIIETMIDLKEALIALRAAREVTDIPILCSVTCEKDGRTFTGTPAEVALTCLQANGADFVGLNCGIGPEEIYPIYQKIAALGLKNLFVQPNAGLPKIKNDKTVYEYSPQKFAEYSKKFLDLGVNILGACCGTSPDFTRETVNALKGFNPIKTPTPLLSSSSPLYKLSAKSYKLPLPFSSPLYKLSAKSYRAAGPFSSPSKSYKLKAKSFPCFPSSPSCLSCLSSRTRLITHKNTDPLLIIGERINSTGKKNLREEILAGRTNLIISEAKKQTLEGADILDINLGVKPEIEEKLMATAVNDIQNITNAALCIDSTNLKALEIALKNVVGKALINSVNADDKSLKTVLPLVKKYGAAVIGLTLSGHQIPTEPKERFKLAKKIFDVATKKYGIPPEEIFIDVLTMTLSTDDQAAQKTLQALKLVKKNLPCKTVLGVSNVSFGLPHRDILTAHFLAQAMSAGLDAAIVNPGNAEIMKAYHSTNLLLGKDPSSQNYLEFATTYSPQNASCKDVASQRLYPAKPPVKEPFYPARFENDQAEEVFTAVLEGKREQVSQLFQNFLQKTKLNSEQIVNEILIPAMQVVGDRFDKKTYFLPQVLLSAETMQTAFKILKNTFFKNKKIKFKGKILLATVEGDIHDIGKNIVKTVLESHGYEVKDLGKSISAKQIVASVEKEKPQILGLSALMTTTMPRMKEVLNFLKKKNLKVKTMVGGAVVTKDYAHEIGADSYAKDAISAVKEVEKLLK